MKPMPMHITTWLRSSTHGMATAASTVPTGLGSPPCGLTPVSGPAAPLRA